MTCDLGPAGARRRPAPWGLLPLLLSLLVAASAAPALAAEPAVPQACRGAAQTLCTGVQPGQGRIAQCLHKHEARLSPACKEQLDEVEACRAERRKACPEARSRSAQRLCADDKRAEFSPGCRAGAAE